MSGKPHSFIKQIEKGRVSPFSVFKIKNVDMVNTKNGKFELVYLYSTYPNTQYDEVIYKTTSDFYLLFKSTQTLGKYNLHCYFPAEKINQVQVFMNSISKKNDTSNI